MPDSDKAAVTYLCNEQKLYSRSGAAYRIEKVGNEAPSTEAFPKC
jgi:hypothetical protein